jgi:hypothetical protein
LVTVTNDWRHLPAAARPIAAAATAAVAAAHARDGEALAEAVARLAALDPSTTGLILGTTVRLLLEETHPDGLDGDDVRKVLEHCVHGAARSTTTSRRPSPTTSPCTPPCSWPICPAPARRRRC